MATAAKPTQQHPLVDINIDSADRSRSSSTSSQQPLCSGQSQPQPQARAQAAGAPAAPAAGAARPQQAARPSPNFLVRVDQAIQRNADLINKAFSEMVGTALLVCLSCGVCVQGANNPLAVALSFGTTLSAIAVALGPVSGCHLNPAVSLGMLIDGQINFIECIWYCMAQLMGGCVGASGLSGLLPRNDRLCANMLLQTSPSQAVFVEFIVTYLLVLVYCRAGRDKLAIMPLVVGLAVTAGHLFASPLSSASMNTARWFGPALIQHVWDDWIVFLSGPLIGGACAGLSHKFLFNEDKPLGTTVRR